MGQSDECLIIQWRPRVLSLADRMENRRIRKYKNREKYLELGGMQKILYLVTAILERQCHMRGVLTQLMVSAYEQLVGRSTRIKKDQIGIYTWLIRKEDVLAFYFIYLRAPKQSPRPILDREIICAILLFHLLSMVKPNRL